MKKLLLAASLSLLAAGCVVRTKRFDGLRLHSSPTTGSTDARFGTATTPTTTRTLRSVLNPARMDIVLVERLRVPRPIDRDAALARRVAARRRHRLRGDVISRTSGRPVIHGGAAVRRRASSSPAPRTASPDPRRPAAASRATSRAPRDPRPSGAGERRPRAKTRPTADRREASRTSCRPGCGTGRNVSRGSDGPWLRTSPPAWGLRKRVPQAVRARRRHRAARRPRGIRSRASPAEEPPRERRPKGHARAGIHPLFPSQSIRPRAVGVAASRARLVLRARPR